METVKLKNGSDEFGPLVVGVMLSLKALAEKNPIAFYEIVQLARNRNHKFFGNVEKDLQDFSLLGSDSRLHSSIRNIVLSASEGDGIELKLVSPYAKE